MVELDESLGTRYLQSLLLCVVDCKRIKSTGLARSNIACLRLFDFKCKSRKEKNLVILKSVKSTISVIVHFTTNHMSH